MKQVFSYSCQETTLLMEIEFNETPGQNFIYNSESYECDELTCVMLNNYSIIRLCLLYIYIYNRWTKNRFLLK